MTRRLRLLGTFAAAWLVVALPVGALFFATGSKTTVVASHDAVVSPSFDGYATLDLGPYLPNLRYPTGGRLGTHVKLGKTNLTSYEDLIARYAVIGSQPAGEIAKLRRAVVDIAEDSAVSGALAGLAGPALWALLGAERRGDLFRHVTLRRTGLVGLAGVVMATALAQPWDRPDPVLEQRVSWSPITEELDVPIPAQARDLEIEAGLITSSTRRLAESLFDSYRKSAQFYEDVVEGVPAVADLIREPEEGETVAVLVSDRHDNIGMDRVARAIADEAGATILLDAGDDTSTGSSWEAFSLDSLHEAFADYEYRYAVTGNHDHGAFTGTYAGKLGFTRFDEESQEGPDGIRLFGADDPRSSGLGSWRDETGLSFAEHADRVADQACEYDAAGERISTLLVHDANTGRPALERGCVDLVVGGHVHVQLGPTLLEGENGAIGYTYSSGTTGGAAYAIAIGSKLRRDAMVSLVTYREGRPAGVQPVTVRTLGDFQVGEYVEISPASPDPETAEPTDEATGTTSSPSGEESP